MAPFRRRLAAVLIAAVIAIAAAIGASPALAASPKITLTFSTGSAFSFGSFWLRAKGTADWKAVSYEAVSWTSWNGTDRRSTATISGLKSGGSYQLAFAPWGSSEEVSEFFVSTSTRTGTSDPSLASYVPAGASVAVTTSKPTYLTGSVTFPQGSNSENRSARVVALSSAAPATLPDGMFDESVGVWGSPTVRKASFRIAVLPGTTYRVGVAPSAWEANDVYGTQWALGTGKTTTAYTKAPRLTGGAKTSFALSVPPTTIWPQPPLTAQGGTQSPKWKAGRTLSIGGLTAWPKGTKPTFRWTLETGCSGGGARLGSGKTYTVTAKDAAALNNYEGMIYVTVTFVEKGHRSAVRTLGYGPWGCG